MGNVKDNNGKLTKVYVTLMTMMAEKCKRNLEACIGGSTLKKDVLTDSSGDFVVDYNFSAMRNSQASSLFRLNFGKEKYDPVRIDWDNFPRLKNVSIRMKRCFNNCKRWLQNE
uniref:Uncharacterized protein n=1 Tax=Romanomermis culicivorax TaxID=13658 RepID=A0A915IIQ8_ROMCU